ncbi:lactate utilization protein [Candidatus Pacearchaeota archaeon]|nr:lactate utilization protein [Candidatus Pacearchaeota archaeon]
MNTHNMDKWSNPADQNAVQATIQSLKKNGIEAEFVKNKEEAKKRALALIPHGAEVMTMTSVTLTEAGIEQEIDNSGKYNSVRKKLSTMDRKTQSREMQKLGAAPEYAIGSVHAVAENGEIFVASNTGSQLPAYAYGADHVIFVVGTQKIVKDHDEAMKRLYQHTLPLESERAKKAYGVPGSFVSKLLIFFREVKPNRIHVIFVGENIGF